MLALVKITTRNESHNTLGDRLQLIAIPNEIKKEGKVIAVSKHIKTTGNLPAVCHKIAQIYFCLNLTLINNTQLKLIYFSWIVNIGDILR